MKSDKEYGRYESLNFPKFSWNISRYEYDLYMNVQICELMVSASQLSTYFETLDFKTLKFLL